MTLKLAINGFGRIGRNTLRGLVESGRTDIEIVAINDLGPVETNAHLLEFDTVHGRFPGTVTTAEDMIDVGRGPIRVTAIRDPADLPWSDIDVVLECTGIFTDRDKAAAHLKNGAKRVLVSAPSKGADRTVVYGVNHGDLTAEDMIVSNASCTTNALAPLARLLDDAFGIISGQMTTVHCYTGSQPTVDKPRKALERSRAAGLSMVPTTTSAQDQTGLVLPALKNRIEARAIRVPTASVSCIDLTVQTRDIVTAGAVNEMLHDAARSHHWLGWTEAPLVSSDLRGRPESLIVSGPQTSVSVGGLLRVFGWYDNESGFSCRMLDMALRVGRRR